MDWKQKIFKPQWQHKDPVVRRAALAVGQEPELVAALGDICLHDEDAGVRLAAARRLNDPEALNRALDSEADAKVLTALRERLRHLAAATGADRLPVAARQAIVAASQDRDLLEAVASLAPEPELRGTALARIERQGFLGDRAARDPDAGLRRMAAAAITQHSTLRRVISETRTTDKALHQELESRLHGELLAAGDEAAVEREALDLCQTMERHAVRHTPGEPEAMHGFRARWATLEDRAGETLTQRYRRVEQRLSAPAAPETADTTTKLPREKPPPEPAPPAAGDGEEERPPDRQIEATLKSIRECASTAADSLTPSKFKGLERKWNRAWGAVSNPSAAELRLEADAKGLLAGLRKILEEREAASGQMLERARAMLGELQTEVGEGELHKALETRVALQELGRKLGRNQSWKAIGKEIDGLQGRLRELRDWLHWSNDKIRKRLIREMEALPSAGLHPDAVLERVRELQGQWKELEESEQIPGEGHYAAAPWMWRKFNAAGRKAFETTKPFLDKRSEIQKKHLTEMRATADGLAQLAGGEPPDWVALGKALSQARRQMRALGEIPPHARHKMAARLKNALERGNQAMQSHYAEVEKRKLKLIREAAQLVHETDRAAAIDRAKALQAEWKAAGALWRSRENDLWREFREPLDPLFGQLKAEQDRIREQRDAVLAGQKALCTDLAALLELDDDSLVDQDGKVQGLRDDWKEIRHPDRRLQQEFQKLLGRYQARVEAQRRKAESATRERWWQKAALLHEAESALAKGEPDSRLLARLEKAWPPTARGEDLDGLLDRRFQMVLSGESGQAEGAGAGAAVEEARRLCICLEFLAGLPSPEEEKNLRMQYQVDRLSESLSGERARMPAREEARALEADWLALPCIPGPEYDHLRARAEAALRELDEVK